jgi:hypothetical protein
MLDQYHECSLRKLYISSCPRLSAISLVAHSKLLRDVNFGGCSLLFDKDIIFYAEIVLNWRKFVFGVDPRFLICPLRVLQCGAQI